MMNSAARELADFADDDLHGDHEFGRVVHDSTPVFWKFDCYDRKLEFGNPADPAQTTLILTFMLAQQYRASQPIGIPYCPQVRRWHISPRPIASRPAVIPLINWIDHNGQGR